MPELTFKGHAQSFVLCDQSDAFMQQHPGQKISISVIKVELYKYIEDTSLQSKYGCAYRKVVGITEDGSRFVLWDGKDRIYRQYGSHLLPPCHYHTSWLKKQPPADG